MRVLFFLFLLSIAINVPMLQGQEATQFFQNYYGEKLKSVNASPQKEDDIALVKSILNDYKSISKLSYQKICLIKAYEIATDIKQAYPLAKKALDILLLETLNTEEEKLHLLKKKYELQKDITKSISLSEKINKQNSYLLEISFAYDYADESEDQEQLETAIKTYQTSLIAAKAIKRDDLNSYAKDKIKQLTPIFIAEKKIENLKKNLLQNPDDPKIHTELTKYFIYYKGDFSKALQYSKKSNEPEIKDLMKLIQQCNQADQKLESYSKLALDLFKCSNLAKNTIAKIKILEASAIQYHQVLNRANTTDEISIARARINLNKIHKEILLAKDEKKAHIRPNIETIQTTPEAEGETSDEEDKLLTQFKLPKLGERSVIISWYLLEGIREIYNKAIPANTKKKLALPILIKNPKLGESLKPFGALKWKYRYDKSGKFRSSIEGNHLDIYHAFIDSPKAQKAMLHSGNSDGVKIVLNKRQIISKSFKRDLKYSEDKSLISLKKGLNSIQVFLSGTKSGSEFIIAITDTKGKPIPNLKAGVPQE